MAITAKPKKNTVSDSSNANEVDEKKAIAFINQGGTVATLKASPQVEEEDKQKGVIVRMYPDMIQ